MGADAPRKPLKQRRGRFENRSRRWSYVCFYCLLNQSINKEMTESPLMMRLNVSASSGAHVS
mgnify:CR=1 FL=1